MSLEFTFDPEADASYISLSGDEEMLAVKQVAAYASPGNYEVILDISAEGRLIGIEVIGATSAFTASVLRLAEEL